MEYSLFFVIVACVIGFMMSCGVGASDLANVMSTTVGSKAISVRKAIIIAIVFEFAGAFFGGIHVTNTIRCGIINTDLFTYRPEILIYGMLAVLASGAIWMLFASSIGMPVSITSAIVGGMVGFGVIVVGVSAIHWGKVGIIVISWICSPVFSCFAAYILFNLVQKLILSRPNPIDSARHYLFLFFFLVGYILAIVIVIKGLHEIGFKLNFWERYTIIFSLASLVTVVGIILCDRIALPTKFKRRLVFNYVEKLFGVLMAFTACAMVFAHGSNDVAISVGPIVAILSIIKHSGDVSMQTTFPLWVLFLGYVGVMFGLFIYGKKVIITVGHGITALTPSRAFCATIAAAGTVVFSTSAGIPVSATQTLVGGVLGVGLARGIGALNIKIIRNIFLSWLVTIPVSATLSVIFFYILKLIFKS